MIDFSGLGQILQGSAAGAQGRGGEFSLLMDERAKLSRERKLQDEQVSDARKAAGVQDAYMVGNLIDSGKYSAALRAVESRIEHINKLGGNPAETIAVYDALKSGDPARVSAARKGLQDVVDSGANLWRPQRPEDSIDYKKFEFEQNKFNQEQALRERAQAWKEQHPNEGAADKNGLFGSPDTVKDEAGNLFKNVIVQSNGGATTRLLPIGHNSAPVGNVSVVGQYGLTAGEKVGQAGAETDITEKKKQANKLSEDLYGKINTINSGLQTFQQGIDAIDKGANTGVIQNLMPSLKASTIELDNVKRRLGADVLTSGIFGIASERDVKTAFDMAAPPLAPQELKKWLVDRQQSQAKVRDIYEKAIDYLAEGNTIADLQKLQRQKRDESNLAINKDKAPKKSGGVLHIDASGNKAMVYPDGSYEEVN